MDSTEVPTGELATLIVRRGGRLVLGVMAVAWCFVLGLVLSRRVLLVPDSVNNNAHVWWIARNLWHHGTLPWRMPVIGHGEAFTFPYGIVNWTTAAIVWPLLGDWGVTLWTVLGSVGCLIATFYAFPELRRGSWWAAAVLANPAVWYALLFGQQTFVWSAALLVVGIGLWRQNRFLLAAVLVGLGQANHPAVVLPIGLAVVVAWVAFGSDDRKRVLRYYAISLAISLPPAFLVLDSPVFTDSTTRDRLFNFVSTVGPRLLVIALPIGLVLMWRRWPRVAPGAFVLALVVTIALWWPLGAKRTMAGVLGHRHPDNLSVASLVHDGLFHPGATYRVLRAPSDSKYTLYSVLRRGGRLDSEFFPESMAHRSFRTTADYGALLCHRDIDFVLVYPSYNYTNEPRLLRLAARDGTPLGVVRVATVVSDGTNVLYRVDRAACPPRL